MGATWAEAGVKLQTYQQLLACCEDPDADEGSRERVLLRLQTFLEAEQARGADTSGLQEDCAARMASLRHARFERTGTCASYVDEKLEGRCGTGRL